MHAHCSRRVHACACVRFNIQVHYLLEQLVVLIESSSSNQVQLCKHRQIRVLLNEFQEVLKVKWAGAAGCGRPIAPLLTLLGCFGHNVQHS